MRAAPVQELCNPRTRGGECYHPADLNPESAVRIALASLVLLLAACPPPEAPEPDVDADAPDVREAEMVAKLAALDLEDLGNPALAWDWVPPVRAPRDAPHMLLVIPVEFSDVTFDRFAGEPDQADQLAAFYQEFLFDDTYSREGTLSHYYADQSGGLYHLNGTVVRPVRLERPLEAYGAPIRPEGGSWRNDSNTEDLIEEALGLAVAAEPDLAWGDFDRWDPKDYDGDGVYDEPDGYIDHLVLVYAGGGQHSCQSIFKLDEALNPNVGMEAYAALSPEHKACADRIWPHRSIVKRREGQGPTVGELVNARGGIPVKDGLWAADYNMQCEYTGASTFQHEFGHSIGLPDLYARTSSNSTGPWDIMSNTADPSAQGFSSWSRMTLGWLEPEVLVPPAFGGEAEVELYLTALDHPVGNDERLHRAVMVALPPQHRTLDLTDLSEAGGDVAMYSGQGNDLSRTLAVELDLTDAEDSTLSFDAWWDIEAAWDFAYVEVSTDGRTWQRITPTTAEHMPARHGHDGVGTVPGFTGISGDLDGDGKNESNPACDPSVDVVEGEDAADAAENPCEVPSWVRPSFDLSAYAGGTVHVRWRYYTDGAAVEPGMLVDNVTVDGTTVDFEGELGAEWSIDGWSPTSGHEEILVPHYYLLEWRDPYIAGTYDANMAKDPGATFYWDPVAEVMRAYTVTPRPGALLWYFNGAYAWSENDPAINGPGQGDLLVVDSNPEELSVPGIEDLYTTDGPFTSRYELDGEGVQDRLSEGFYATLCFVREPQQVPPGLDPEQLAAHCAEQAGVQALSRDGKHFRNTYEIRDLLPGPDKDAWLGAGELYDSRTRGGELSYRLRDRSLRYVHTLDAPFHWEPYPDQVRTYTVEGDQLVPGATTPAPAHAVFSDTEEGRWMNPNLPFDGADVPAYGFSFEVSEPGEGAPLGAAAKVTLRWSEVP